MDFKDILYIFVLALLLLTFSLLSSVSFISFFYFQFVFAIAIYINYRTVYTTIALSIVLVLVDATVGSNPAFSLLSLACGGLIISITNKIYPFLKQQPFLVARIVWLVIASTVFSLLNGWFLINPTFIIAQVFNILLLVGLTLIVEPMLSKKTVSDITIN